MIETQKKARNKINKFVKGSGSAFKAIFMTGFSQETCKINKLII